MLGVDERSVQDAARAVVPIRAIKALVTYARDTIIAPITVGVMGLVTARSKATSDFRLKPSSLDCGNEAVLGGVTVTVLSKARAAKVVVFASRAMNKLNLGQLLNAAVAGANARVEEVIENRDDSLSRSGDGLLGRQLRLLLHLLLRGDTLSSAVDDETVLNESLDQPVVRTVARDALINTVLAKVKVAIIAGRAVVVSLGNMRVAVVTADSIVGANWASVRRRNDLDGAATEA